MARDTDVVALGLDAESYTALSGASCCGPAPTWGTFVFSVKESVFG